MSTTTSQPDPYSGQTTADVNAILQGMTDARIDQIQARRAQQRGQQQAALPPQVQPDYQPPMPTVLQPQSPSPLPSLDTQPQQQASILPPQLQPRQPPVQLQPQPPVQQQPPPLTGERPPLNNMPQLWNGGQRGPSGVTKQQFLVGRMMHESQGDPTILNYVARQNPAAYDQGFTAGGLLQDLNTTWAQGVQWASADPNRYPMSADPRQYKTAREAPWDVQWQVNSAIYDHAGETPWREQNGGFRANALIGVRDQLDQRTPTQQFSPATPRDFGQWGRQAPGFGMNQPGAMPRPNQFGQIMGNLAPLLVGIASLALRMPLSTAITAYGAMERARQNGQNQEYERNRTKWQDQLKEATAQQALESHDAADAFSEYGNNNPAGLQQTLAQIAMRYNDPVMFQMAERGDLNGIYKMQQRRDTYNQDLTKLHKAAQDEQDQRDVNADVAARDHQWAQEHPNATPDEAAIAHAQHLGQAQQDFKGGAGGEQEGPVMDVIGQDGKPTGQQVRSGKQGGYFDPNTRQPVQLQPGETVQQTPRRGGGQGGQQQEGLALYDVIDKDGNPTGRQVRMGKQGGLFDLGSPPQQVTLGDGESVRPVSRQAQPRPASAVPDTWKGAPYTAPPGVDAGLWQQAINWAEQGRPPVGLGGRTSSMYSAVEPLVPAAMKALGIQSLSEQALKYEARRHALNSIETGFGSGVNGRNLISLNTVADHISLFRQYAEALKNGDVQQINRLRNMLSTQAGSPEVIDFALAGRITGDEVVRLLTTTGGTLADREDIASRLASFDSPDQFEGAANTLTNYVRGRYLPLRQAYARGDPERERYFDNNMVTPEARHLFQGPQAPIPGQDGNQQPQQPGQRSGAVTPPSWADPQGQPAYLNGRTIWHKPDGKWYFDDQTPVLGQ